MITAHYGYGAIEKTCMTYAYIWLLALTSREKQVSQNLVLSHEFTLFLSKIDLLYLEY